MLGIRLFDAVGRLAVRPRVSEEKSGYGRVFGAPRVVRVQATRCRFVRGQVLDPLN